jgi:hypothetical protein
LTQRLRPWRSITFETSSTSSPRFVAR